LWSIAASGKAQGGLENGQITGWCNPPKVGRQGKPSLH